MTASVAVRKGPHQTPNPPTGNRSVAGQGILMSAGFAGAQLLSFIRNAALGYLLSKGDFGIAATLTITLQVFELLTDVAADRLILQAPDGDRRHFVAVAHAITIARGFLIGTIMFLLAPVIAAFFRIPEITWAFQWMAMLPVIKGFMNLDARRQQRHLNNLPMVWLEIGPQLAALAIIWPAVLMTGSFEAVLYAATAQSIVMLALSHAIAQRRYKVRFDEDIARRFITFAWPILLSALPLFAVYQGERLVVARLFDMETLASFSVAFMITMVPSVLATKIGISLGLPLISKQINGRGSDDSATQLLAKGLLAFTLFYTVGFVLIGGDVVRIAFGPQYAGLDPLVSAFACMWAIRIIQITPGAALMAHTDTKPLLTCGMIRALALVPALILALNGADITHIVWTGFVAECFSCLYAFYRLDTHHNHRVEGIVTHIAVLVATAIIAFWLKGMMPDDMHLTMKIFVTTLAMFSVTLVLLGLFPDLRKTVLRQSETAKA